MSNLNPCPVLIVGAGPVGLTMAAHLHRLGLAPRIIDKAPAPSDKSKALAIWGRTLEMLETLGLAEAFTSAGMFLNGARVYSYGRPLLHLTLNVPGTAYPRPLLLPQSETERLLTEHLGRAGVCVERPVEMIGFHDDGNGVTATLRQADGREQQLRCDWLIGCDGAHSLVRKKLGLEFVGQADPNDFILADCRVDGPVAMDELTGFWHSQGVVGIFPFTPTRCRIIADMGPAPGTERPADPSLAQVQAILDERGAAGIRVSDPHWLAGFRIHERMVAEYRRGRVFLCGDAAHIHSPAGGQGMNTGMQDTWNLSWKLAWVQTGKAKPILLDSYSPERSAVGRIVLRNAGRLTRLITLHNPVALYLRNQVIRLLGKVPAFQRDFARSLAEMTIRYPNSPLNGESTGDWPRQSIRPGDRFPDLLVRDPRTGRDERLFRILHGTGYNLLLLPLVADAATLSTLRATRQQVAASYGGLVRSHLLLPSAGSRTEPEGFDSLWIDSGDEVRRRLGARETALALVRPDGYLADRGQPAAWNALRTYLERFLIAEKPEAK